jgi:hypothetical protein
MMLEGKSMYAMRDHINAIRDYDISYSQVVYDCGVIQKQWVKEYLSDINLMKGKELARIDRIEKEAWEAWERSKRNITRSEKEQVENSQMDKSDQVYQKHRKVRAKQIETERDADRKFMEIVQWCVEKRCDILGFNAAKRYDISWRKEAKAAGYNPDEVVEDLAKQFVEAAQKGVKSE